MAAKRKAKKKAVAKKTAKKATAGKKTPARKIAKAVPHEGADKPVVEVLLESLQVNENSIMNDKAFGVIKFDWKYPKPGKASIEAIVPFVSLGDGPSGQIDFTQNPYTLADRYLFKYQPSGRSVIQAEVAITQRPGLVSKILSSLLRKGISMVPNPVVGMSLGMLLDFAGLTKEKVRVIGQTSFEIPAHAHSEELVGELIIPESFNVYKQDKFSTEWDDDDVDDFEDEQFRVGDTNGRITLSLNI